ncbi:MAG TPA: hypothetical protein VKI44_42585 [Acetobacteraceae bacterium]|nr:hypothetical protein [Acetobacteraceae bacterium]
MHDTERNPIPFTNADLSDLGARMPQIARLRGGAEIAYDEGDHWPHGLGLITAPGGNSSVLAFWREADGYIHAQWIASDTPYTFSDLAALLDAVIAEWKAESKRRSAGTKRAGKLPELLAKA